MSGYEYIKVIEAPEVHRIVLARPALNVLNIAMMKEINDVLARLMTNTQVKALVITAEGRTFSAGVSIEEHLGDRAQEMLYVFDRIFRQLHRLPCVTIAGVQGPALGGGAELATFCDVAIASPYAKIGQPETKVGVFPPIAVLHYPKRIGQNRTLQLLLSGDILSAGDAERIGLVDRVVPADQLEEAIDETVKRFTDKSRAVLALTRRVILGPSEFERRLDELESVYMNELMNCHDSVEGLHAFLEKRQPVWTNR